MDTRLVKDLEKILSENQHKLYQKLIGRKVQSSSTPVVFNNEPMELTDDQKRLWLVTQINSDSHMLNLASVYRLPLDTDIDKLQTACNHLIGLQDQLRCYVDATYSTPKLIVANDLSVKLEVIDVQSNTLDYHILEETNRTFDISCAPLIRCLLLRTSDSLTFIVVMHHLIADGISQEIFIDQLVKIYNDQKIQLSNNFSSYQLWLKKQKSNSEYQNQLAFWRNKMEGVSGKLNLPLDYPRPDVLTFRGKSLSRKVSPKLYSTLKKYLAKHNLSEFSGLLATYASMISQLSNQQDFVVGVPSASRLRHDVSNVIGFFANTMAVRLKMEKHEADQDLISHVQQTLDECFDNSLVNFADVIQLANPERVSNYTPLVQVMFSYLPQNEPKYIHDTKIQRLPITSDSAEFDLFWIVQENDDDGLDIQVQFNSDLFSIESVDNFINLYTDILQKLVRMESPAADGREDIGKVEEVNDTVSPLHLTSNFTVEPIKPVLDFLLEQTGCRERAVVSDYDQVIQELLMPASGLRQSQNGGFIVLNLEKWLSDDFDNRVSDFLSAVTTACDSGCRLNGIISTRPSPKLMYGEVEKILDTEKELHKLANEYSFSFISFNSIDTSERVINYYDEISREAGDIPYTPEYFAALAETIGGLHFTQVFKPYKVIVLDCDNTLWAGACGDLGANDIVIDEAHLKLQEKIIQCQEAGALVCLASKNTPESVEDVFSSSKRMLLKNGHIVAKKVNWEAKSTNIKTLAEELNLGLDSFLFIDDNPVEISEVSMNCPDVTCLLYPEKLDDRRRFATNNWLLNMAATSTEDVERTRMYRENIRRNEEASQFTNFEEFIKKLEVNVDIRPLTKDSISRASQMSFRTNQFNATTIRRDESEFDEVLNNSNQSCFIVSVCDKYGSYGDVGLIVLNIEGDSVIVESFIMSCRVLGRTVENQMIRFVGEFAKTNNKSRVIFNIEHTVKNEPIRKFYSTVFGSGKNYDSLDIKRYEVSSGTAAIVPLFIEESGGKEIKKSTPSVGAKINVEQYQKVLSVLGSPKKLVNIHKSIEANHQESEPKIDFIRNESSLAIDHAKTSKVDIVKIEDNTSLTPKVSESESIHSQEERELLERSQPFVDSDLVNAIEDKIEAVWQDVLSISRIDRQRNFFDLGGTSILMVQVNSQLKQRYDISLTMVDLFKFPTISGLAEKICGGSAQPNKTEKVSSSRGSKQRQLLKRSLKRKVR